MSKTQEKSDNQVESDDSESTLPIGFNFRLSTHESFEQYMFSLFNHLDQALDCKFDDLFNRCDAQNDYVTAARLKDFYDIESGAKTLRLLIQAYDFFKLKNGPPVNPAPAESFRFVDTKETLELSVKSEDMNVDSIDLLELLREKAIESTTAYLELIQSEAMTASLKGIEVREGLHVINTRGVERRAVEVEKQIRKLFEDLRLLAKPIVQTLASQELTTK